MTFSQTAGGIWVIVTKVYGRVYRAGWDGVHQCLVGFTDRYGGRLSGHERVQLWHVFLKWNNLHFPLL